MLPLLYRSAAGWTAVGLTGGLFYREFTKLNDVAGGTQLALVHTHTLVLGTVVSLVLLALVGIWSTLATTRPFRAGFWVWQAGLVLTTGGMLVKGVLQVLGSDAADSAALAGVSGLGHMVLTGAFVLLFVGMGRVVRQVEAERRLQQVLTAAAGTATETARAEA